jgi:osmoprotectant transport system substrate-binding protein
VWVAALVATLAGLMAGACGSSGGDDAAGAARAARLRGTEITVGSADFPESTLLGEIYAQALEARGANVTRRFGLGAREVYFPAAERGEVTLVPEYTNSLLSFVVRPDAPTATNVSEQVDALRAALPANLTVLTPSTAEDKDVIVCRRDVSDRYQLKTLSDLATVSGDIVLGAAPEFEERSPFGVAGLRDILGAEFKEFKPLGKGQQIVDALAAGEIQCGNLFSTNSYIRSNDLVTMQDDQVIVPNEAVIPLIAKDKATADVQAVLDAVSSTLDTNQLADLMVHVEQDGDAPADVAAGWLDANGLS